MLVAGIRQRQSNGCKETRAGNVQISSKHLVFSVFPTDSGTKAQAAHSAVEASHHTELYSSLSFRTVKNEMISVR